MPTAFAAARLGVFRIPHNRWSTISSGFVVIESAERAPHWNPHPQSAHSARETAQGYPPRQKRLTRHLPIGESGDVGRRQARRRPPRQIIRKCQREEKDDPEQARCRYHPQHRARAP